MKRRNIILIVAWNLLLMISMNGQDLHFSQFMNSPLTTNPANTGFIPGGDYRIGVNYRNQWSSIMAIPYKTMSAFGDAQVMRNRFETGWIGAGGVILRDVAGSGNLTSTKIYGSIAYHQLINAGSLVSAGFNVGWANKQINISNLKFPDQYDGKFFDNKLPTSVVLANNNINYLDIQLGLNYAYFPNERIYLNTGYSAHHVNRPRESFFNQTAGVDNRVAIRHIGFINGSFLVNNQWLVNPNIYFTTQAKSIEMVAGLNAHYDLSGDGAYQLIGGLYYRYKDAFIPMVGLQWNDIKATFTYDVTISTLKNYNNGRGAFEFSLIKEGLFDSYMGNKRQSMCPDLRNKAY
ncbi:MAG TPA: PorP/SprF family type IX secretion system membrane protein [Chitinophagaceae bacterium]|nr:PorP/SprF family type IX secretion system membrane protein [Chitinophagaceae bacterium]